LLKLARATAYDHPTSLLSEDLAVMRRIDERHLQYPFAGGRMLRDVLRREGHGVGRRHVATLMRRMGITAIYRTPRTSQRHPTHRVSPALLRQLAITRPNHVWAADITDLPMKRGFLYLCAVPNWVSRRVRAWRLSHTLTTDFCIEAVREAVTQYSCPKIFHSDQGCPFPSREFSGFLKDHGIQISMDGIGRWPDNVFVERLWQSLKYEEVYLHSYETVRAAQQGVERYPSFYSQARPHRALDGRKPDRVYWENRPARYPAA
jgi:putative transposase